MAQAWEPSTPRDKRERGRPFLFLVFFIALVAFSFGAGGCGAQNEKSSQADSSACVQCHENTTPGILGQWRDSAHNEANVGCLDCHQANEGEPDAFEHNGKTVAIIVSPKDCSRCHEKEEQQNSASHHASANQFIGSLDNVLGEIVEGGPAANSGCKQCHGSNVKVLENGKLDPATWPNTGIGRVNPDGSKGSCSACHGRHEFSKAQAREPYNCGKCHLGPDHPQKEVYEESKHGILFIANHDKMNLDSKSWIAGQDYTAAPTCATCHMGQTPNQEASHDVGARISWTLRPAISTKLPEADKRRENMKDVCVQCHSSDYVGNFYTQFDNAVNLYNTKFGAPAKAIIDQLRAENLLTPTPYDEKIEWTYYELWHHEGRRARHGASMSGPDYVQWIGFYEVAKNFYTEFLPQAEELKPGISDPVLAEEVHKWKQGLSPEEIAALLQFYQERYGE